MSLLDIWVPNPYHPWDWYLPTAYMNGWFFDFYGILVGKYTGLMDGMRMWWLNKFHHFEHWSKPVREIPLYGLVRGDAYNDLLQSLFNEVV